MSEQEQAIRSNLRRNNIHIQDLVIEIQEDKILINGEARSYYEKQQTQEAARKVIKDTIIYNRIRVA